MLRILKGMVLGGVVATASTASADCFDERFVYGKNSLKLADDTHVGAALIGTQGYFEAGVGAQLHADVTAGYIQLRNYAVLNGRALSNGLGKQFGAVVTGGTGSPLTCSQPTVPAITPGSTDIFVTGTVELPPGDYRDVSVSVEGTLVLTSGEYNLRTLIFAPDSNLVSVWQGAPTSVRVADAVSFADRHVQRVVGAEGFATSSPAVSISTPQWGPLTVGTDSNVEAAILAPNADIRVFSRTTLSSRVYGRSITVEPQVTLGKYIDVNFTVCGEG